MQQVIKGEGCLQHLTALLRQRGAKKVLFVTGQHLLNEDFLLSLLQSVDLSFEQTQPPSGVLQMETVPSFPSVDTVVAIGGGKVMDFAKGIVYRQPRPATLMAAPTTAGSGSEATPFAVFYQGKEKLSLDAPHLLPAVALLDPLLLNNLPPGQRAISGADALAQCIESVWNVHSSPASETIALEGMALLWRHLYSFVHVTSQEVAGDVLWAAHLGGKAIATTRTTGPHALSYFLTAHFGVPHGQAVALTVPLFFLYNDGEETRQQLQKIYAVLQMADAEEAFAACRQLFGRMGLATTLTELGLQNMDLDQWLQSVNRQRFANNPVPLDPARLKDLFRRYLL